MGTTVVRSSSAQVIDHALMLLYKPRTTAIELLRKHILLLRPMWLDGVLWRVLVACCLFTCVVCFVFHFLVPPYFPIFRCICFFFLLYRLQYILVFYIFNFLRFGCKWPSVLACIFLFFALGLIAVGACMAKSPPCVCNVYICLLVCNLLARLFIHVRIFLRASYISPSPSPDVTLIRSILGPPHHGGAHLHFSARRLENSLPSWPGVELCLPAP